MLKSCAINPERTHSVYTPPSNKCFKYQYTSIGGNSASSESMLAGGGDCYPHCLLRKCLSGWMPPSCPCAYTRVNQSRLTIQRYSPYVGISRDDLEVMMHLIGRITVASSYVLTSNPSRPIGPPWSNLPHEGAFSGLC